jgi:hypothetical protein
MAEADGGGCAFQQASSGVFILMPGSTMPPRFPISVPPYRSAKAGGRPAIRRAKRFRRRFKTKDLAVACEAHIKAHGRASVGGKILETLL